jgi:conjugative relaxase-like TrwC/TraI family protein
MISKAQIANAKGIARHVRDTTRTAEYYTGEDVPSTWVGGACADLGLAGAVDEKTLVDQLEGRVTDATGERRLGKVNADGSIDRRMGWDFTISESKSLSIEREAFGNQAVAGAIAESNKSVLAYFEDVGGWARIKGERVHTGKLAVATFEHVESRRGDMDVHTHALVMNTTTHDGKAYALSNEQLFAHRRAADALKHMEEGFALSRAGYAVRYDAEGHVELAGYTREQIETFSKGSAEVESALAQKGLTRDTADWAERNASNLETRDKKSAAETRGQAQTRWQEEARVAGIERAQYDPAVAREWAALDADGEARRAIAEAVEKLTEREFVFTLPELHIETAKAAQGRSTLRAVVAEVERAIERGEIIRDPRDGRLTTREAQATERDMAGRLETGRHAHEAVMTAREFEIALDEFEERKTTEGQEAGWLKPGERFHLKPEQEAAARMVLTGDDRFAAVQGLPGTGKTTTLQFVREAAESKGWTVIGHSNGAEQAQKMEAESGIRTTTTAAHLIAQERDQRDKPRAATQRELRIMDEASQSGQRQFNRVLATSEHAGAKTIFLGDRYQHQSVEAGKAFERAQAHMPVAELGRETISRQKTEHARAVVSAILDKDYHRAIARMDVRECRANQDGLSDDASRSARRHAARLDNAEVVAAIGRDYAALDHRERDETMIVTGTNDDRKSINAAIRDELKQRGELADGLRADTLQKVDMDAVDARRAVFYEPGQVIEAVAESKRQNIARGERFEVKSVDSSTNTVRAVDAAGRERTLDPAHAQFKAYDREQREFAKGDRVRFVENHKLDDGTAVRNGQRGQVTAVDAERATITIHTAGRDLTVATRDAKVDYSYSTTSQSGQGHDRQHLWKHHNVEAGRHGEREATVDATRAKFDHRLYTQDLAKAERQMGVKIDKTAAHDVGGPDTRAEIPRPEKPREREQDRVTARAARSRADESPPRRSARLRPTFDDLKRDLAVLAREGREKMQRHRAEKWEKRDRKFIEKGAGKLAKKIDRTAKRDIKRVAKAFGTNPKAGPIRRALEGKRARQGRKIIEQIEQRRARSHASVAKARVDAERRQEWREDRRRGLEPRAARERQPGTKRRDERDYSMTR